MNIPTDPADMVVDYICENLVAAANFADAAHALAVARDIIGLQYAVAKFVAHARQVASTTKELVAQERLEAAE